MNININGLGEELLKFYKEPHRNQTVEYLTQRILEIFDKFGVSNADYSIIKLAFNNGTFKVGTETKGAFAKSTAKDIFEREKKKEELEKKNNKQDKSYLKEKFKSVSPIDVCDFEVQGKNLKEINEFVINKFLSLGFTEEEIKKPMSAFIDGCSSSESLIENFKNTANVFASRFKTHDKTNENENTTSENEIQDENTEVNVNQNEIINGVEVTPEMKRMDLYQDEPEENDLGENDLKNDDFKFQENQPEELPNEVKKLIDAWGVERINNMNDWKEFMETEGKMLQERGLGLSKDDSSSQQ